MLATHDYYLLSNSLIVGALLFAIGTIGFVARRNLIVMILAAGMMLQGVILTFSAFSGFHGNWSGQLFSLFALAVTAIEGALSLALITVFVRREGSLDVSRWQHLRDRDLPPETDEPEPLAADVGGVESTAVASDVGSAGWLGQSASGAPGGGTTEDSAGEVSL